MASTNRSDDLPPGSPWPQAGDPPDDVEVVDLPAAPEAGADALEDLVGLIMIACDADAAGVLLLTDGHLRTVVRRGLEGEVSGSEAQLLALAGIDPVALERGEVADRPVGLSRAPVLATGQAVGRIAAASAEEGSVGPVLWIARGDQRRLSDAENRSLAFAAAQAGSHLSAWAEADAQARSRRRLSAEADVLLCAAQGRDLSFLMDRLARHLEALVPGGWASVLLLGEDGRLHDVAGSSLPAAYREAIDRLAPGPTSGACGAAAHLGIEILVDDIADDPSFELLRDVALQHGLRACWSVPVLAPGGGGVLGTLAVYHDVVCSPSSTDLETLRRLSDLAALLIDRDRAEHRSRRLTAIIDRVDDAVVAIDLASGTVAYVNSILSEWLGVERDELLGRPPDASLLGIGPKDVATSDGLDSASVRTRTLELAGPTDGPSRICDVRLQRIRGQLVAVYRDVTEKRWAEARLRERERLYRSVTESAQDLIYRMQVWPDLRLQYVNPAGAALSGFDVEELHARPDLLGQALDEADTARIRDARRSFHPDAWPVEVRWRRPDGQELWLLVRESPILDEDGRLVAVHGIAIDNTRRHREEEALRSALEREQAAAEHLRAVDEIKASFLQAVSHELRTPLTALSGFVTTLRRYRDQLGEEKVTYLLERAEHNAQRLGQLLTDLLDVDRLSRSSVEASRSPTSVPQLVGNVVAELDVTSHPVDMRGPRLTVPLDAAKVERVVDNLLRNALKHTPAGTEVRVTWEPADGGVLLAVEDAGPGVPEELHGSIFEPFEQAPSSRGVASPGAGIGLSLVARIAELHHGRAWVETGPGGVGARFNVLLPGE